MGKTYKENRDIKGRSGPNKARPKRNRTKKQRRVGHNSYNVMDLEHFEEDDYEKFSKKR